MTDDQRVVAHVSVSSVLRCLRRANFVKIAFAVDAYYLGFFGPSGENDAVLDPDKLPGMFALARTSHAKKPFQCRAKMLIYVDRVIAPGTE